MSFKATPCFCGMYKRTAHSIRILLFKQPVRGEGSAHWPTATSIYDSECVCMCMCVCCLTIRSTPHLLHWFTPPPTPHTHTSHLLTEWQPTLAYWNSTHSLCPACWGSHQSSCRTPGPLGCPSNMKPSSFFPPCPSFSLIPHPRVLSSTLASLNYSSVYISCQARVKNDPANLEHRVEWGYGVNQYRHRANNFPRYVQKYTPDLDFLIAKNYLDKQ